MLGSREKEKILDKNGYAYHFDRMLYFNKKTKKVFSWEWVDDNNKDMLIEKINENNKNEWEFYSNTQLSGSVKKEITKELET